MSLWSDFRTNDRRPIHKWTHYFPAYEHHLARFVNQSVTLLEIGCGWGGSLQMWKSFLGPFAQVVGVDIMPAASRFAELQIEIRIGNQSDPAFLDKLVDEYGPFDVVVDDGSHMMSDVCASFAALYEQTTGVYMVEDLHTAYWDDFEGGLGREGTFIELFKGLVDELHAEYTNGALAPTAFTTSTMSMHVYDSLLVFEKGRHVHKQAVVSGHRSLYQQTGSKPWRRLPRSMKGPSAPAE